MFHIFVFFFYRGKRKKGIITLLNVMQNATIIVSFRDFKEHISPKSIMLIPFYILTKNCSNSFIGNWENFMKKKVIKTLNSFFLASAALITLETLHVSVTCNIKSIRKQWYFKVTLSCSQIRDLIIIKIIFKSTEIYCSFTYDNYFYSSFFFLRNLQLICFTYYSYCKLKIMF